MKTFATYKEAEECAKKKSIEYEMPWEIYAKRDLRGNTVFGVQAEATFAGAKQWYSHDGRNVLARTENGKTTRK